MRAAVVVVTTLLLMAGAGLLIVHASKPPSPVDCYGRLGRLRQFGESYPGDAVKLIKDCKR